MRNFQSWYQIFGNSWMYFNFGGSLKTHRDSKIHMIPWEKVFEIWRWCKLQKYSPWHELYILARYEHFTSIYEHVTRISHGKHEKIQKISDFSKFLDEMVHQNEISTLLRTCFQDFSNIAQWTKQGVHWFLSNNGAVIW